MKTMKNVLAAANEQVASLMSKGYMISFMNSSFGYAFRVDLENGDKRVRVKVEEKHGFRSADTMVLTVIEIAKADGFESENAEVFYSKTWYVVESLHDSVGNWLSDYLLTESEEEINAIREKRHNRYAASRESYYTKTLTPSAALIRGLKKRTGFSNTTRNTIIVKRTEKGYELNLKARDGHISRTETIRFPKR
ncbi:MAG: hypothetical protein J6M06_01950 [Synergistaceae bacterium]|nr:hypothetical protein [Synergistaceae bacterium]